MKNKKKLFSLVTALALFSVVVFSVFYLVSCANKNVKAKFMVKNDDLKWSVYKEVLSNDKKIEIPKEPKIEYYIFSGWFLDEELTKVFNANDIKEKNDFKVYAKYIPEEVEIVINGINKGRKNLVDIVNNKYETKKGLKFDSWYKDKSCKVKWDGKETVNKLYAQEVAVITIDNGYETLYKTEVLPNTIFKSPKEQKVNFNNEETTLEKQIIKSYMDPDNIDYFDENDNEMDFTKQITKNTNIKVRWVNNSKGILYILNPKTGNYSAQVTSVIDGSTCLSLRSNVVAEVNENGEKIKKRIKVETVYGNSTGIFQNNMKKVMFEDGIKLIKGFTPNTASQITEIVLPKSIEIIDASFNNMPLLKEIKIPEGTKIIIGSFFKVTYIDYQKYNSLGEAYDFEIKVPSSVINMAMVPNNFTFENGSSFYKENGYIYKY